MAYQKKPKSSDPSYTRMMRNLPAKKYSKKSPTQIRLSFEGTGGTTRFVDLAKALSIINRRFYRQGVYYYVNSVELYNNEDAYVDLHTLPDTYVTKNAWNRGFAIWNEMNNKVRAPYSNIGLPKYHDFKVYMSDLHRTSGSMKPALHNINAAKSEPVADDWEYSQYVSGDSDGDIVVDPTAPSGYRVNQEADNFYIHMLGDHVGSTDNWTSVGLIKSYSETRPYPDTSGQPVIDTTSPTNAKNDPLTNLFDLSTEEMVNDIVTRLDEDNDQTPYDNTTYIGESASHMQHVARLATSTTTGRVTKAAGFCVPFGLVCIDPQATATAYRVVFNLAQGTYNGVYAERA